MADTAEKDSSSADDEYTKRARAAMTQSTTYLDTNYRSRLEENIALFQNRHPPGSKYNTDAYRLRSKFFRPKTRSAIRNTEAAAAIAFFSNEDVVSVTAENDNDPVQQASAEINKALLQYRLTKTIPWFRIVVGGVQDAQVMGVVCSYQYWKYREKKVAVEEPIVDPMTGQQVIDEETGEPAINKSTRAEIVEDQPCIELVPLENVRFHPGADWTDPVNSSPYVIRLFPMYAQDVRQQMKAVDTKTGRPKWYAYTDQEIASATSISFDSTRQARQPGQQDPQGNTVASEIGDYQVVWIQEHIHRINGEEKIWYMLGDRDNSAVRLSDPAPLTEVYLHGKRPLVMGTMVIETHKPVPMSPVEMGKQLQLEANEIANQRADNVKFVLNKRYIANRNGRVDISSLVRNVPGSVTLADNPEADVREISFPDVTASAYAEQDRINLDFDELIGNFSQSSVQSNRKLNETVGGLSLLASGANQMTEYGLRVLAETWLEPVLRQLTALEQAYETDPVVLALAGEKSKIFQRYGINTINDEILKQDLVIRVNVGMGATNPQQKLQRFMLGIEAFTKFAAQPPPGANMAEIGKELFGLLGYKDGARFGFGDSEDGQDPRLTQAMQLIQQLQQAIEGKQVEKQAEAQTEMQIEAIRQEGENQRAAMTLKSNQETALLVEQERRRTKVIELADRRATESPSRAADMIARAREANRDNEIASLQSEVKTLTMLLKEAKDNVASAKASPGQAPVSVVDSSAVKPLGDVGKTLVEASKALTETSQTMQETAKAIAKVSDKKRPGRTIQINLPSGKTATATIKDENT